MGEEPHRGRSLLISQVKQIFSDGKVEVSGGESVQGLRSLTLQKWGELLVFWVWLQAPNTVGIYRLGVAFPICLGQSSS